MLTQYLANGQGVVEVCGVVAEVVALEIGAFDYAPLVEEAEAGEGA